MEFTVLLQISVTSAVIAAIISGFFLLFNSWRERTQRKKEMLFRVAFDLAFARAKQTLDAAQASGGSATVHDPIRMAEDYHKWVTEFYSTGNLPAEATANRTW